MKTKATNSEYDAVFLSVRVPRIIKKKLLVIAATHNLNLSGLIRKTLGQTLDLDVVLPVAEVEEN